MGWIGSRGWPALLAAVVVALAVAAPAALAGTSQARPATALVADETGDNTWPLSQTDVLTVSADWSDATLTVVVDYAEPPAARRLSLLISDELAIGDERRCSRFADVWLALEVGADGVPRLELPVEQPALQGTAAWNASGDSVVYSFSDAALTRTLDPADGIDPFACISGSADGDALLGAFEGRLLKITPAAALSAARQALADRFAGRFARAAGRRLVCPREDLSRAGYDTYASATCAFRFRERAGGDRLGTVVLNLVAGLLGPRTPIRSAVASTRRARCGPLVDLRDRDPLIVDRELRASELVGCGGFASELIRRFPRMGSGVRTFTIDDDRFGAFGSLGDLRCRLTRSGTRWVARCANALGDGLVYGYTKTPRPKPAPQPAPPPAPAPDPGPSCDPSYSGACLDPYASDYDCAGGSGNGPLYTGTVQVIGDDHYGLDSDGDGVGCE